MTWHRTILLCCLIFPTGVPATSFADEIVQTLIHTTFHADNSDPDWRSERDCRIVVRDQLFHVDALQGTPQISKNVSLTGGKFRLLLELRTGTESEATLFWTSQGTPRRDETHKVTKKFEEDGHWHTYEFAFTVPDRLTSLMIRFSASDGAWDIRSFQLIRTSPPPFSIREAVPVMYEFPPQTSESGETIPGQKKETIQFTVANDVLAQMKYHVGDQTTERILARNEMVDCFVPIKTEGNLAAVVLRLRPQGFPDIVAPIFLYRPEGNTDWIQKPFGDDKRIEIAPDARMARLWHNETLFGIIAPIVHRNGTIPKFVLGNDSTETELHFESDDVDLHINLEAPFLYFEIADTSTQDDLPLLEGPVVRLFGECRGGLLPGVEF
jgi:hypothetical protein